MGKLLTQLLVWEKGREKLSPELLPTLREQSERKSNEYGIDSKRSEIYLSCHC
jgi:hypothetical protein